MAIYYSIKWIQDLWLKGFQYDGESPSWYCVFLKVILLYRVLFANSEGEQYTATVILKLQGQKNILP